MIKSLTTLYLCESIRVCQRFKTVIEAKCGLLLDLRCKLLFWWLDVASFLRILSTVKRENCKYDKVSCFPVFKLSCKANIRESIERRREQVQNSGPRTCPAAGAQSRCVLGSPSSAKNRFSSASTSSNAPLPGSNTCYVVFFSFDSCKLPQTLPERGFSSPALFFACPRCCFPRHKSPACAHTTGCLDRSNLFRWYWLDMVGI